MVTRCKGAALNCELKRMGLRGADRGKIQGEFEEHFFSSKEPPKGFVFSWELFIEWSERSRKIVQGTEPENADDVSEELEQLFRELFVRLPKKKRITPELRNSWHDKYMGFLLEIWLRRRRGKNTPQGR